MLKKQVKIAGKTSRTNDNHYDWGGTCEGWRLIDRADLGVVYERMPPGTSEVRHYHRQARQFFFVLKGEATIELDGETVVCKSGEGMEISPGRSHQIFNKASNDLEFLLVSKPSSREDRVLA